MNIKGEEDLDDKTVNSNLNDILGYDQVVILHKSLEETLTSSNIRENSDAIIQSFSLVYTTSLYAVKNKTFVKKDDILK